MFEITQYNISNAKMQSTGMFSSEETLCEQLTKILYELEKTYQNPVMVFDLFTRVHEYIMDEEYTTMREINIQRDKIQISNKYAIKDNWPNPLISENEWMELFPVSKATKLLIEKGVISENGTIIKIR